MASVWADDVVSLGFAGDDDALLVADPDWPDVGGAEDGSSWLQATSIMQEAAATILANRCGPMLMEEV